MALTQILMLVEAGTEPLPKKSKATTKREKYVLLPKKLLRDRPILEAFQLNGFKVVVDGLLKCSKNKTFDLINAQVGKTRGKPLLFVDQLHQEFVQEQCKSKFNVDISSVTTLVVLSKEHSKVIKKFLASGCLVNYRDTKRSTLLHLLTETGSVDLLKLFLKHSCKINAKRSDNATALHVAVERKNIQIVSLLVANGANANAKMRDGSTPLTLAVKAGARNIVGLLIANGADVNVRMKDGTTPLSLAFAKGPEKMVELLIENGTRKNLKMETCETPLISAVKKGYLKVVELLIARGANVNLKTEDGSTVLSLAVRSNFFKVVELLIANGANISSGMKDGTTPLHFAVWGGHTQIVEHLLSHGANPDAKSDRWYHKGLTPLHLAAVSYDRCEIVALLLDKGANVNAECSDGKTALYFAVDSFNSLYRPDHKIIEVLAQCGPDVNNAWNKDAFKRAISKRDPKYRQMTSCLLQCGFDVTVEDAGDSSVFFGAVSQNLHQVVEKLLNLDTSVNRTIYLGLTPLHQAACYADGDMVQLLVDHEANINALKYGDTPLSTAIGKSNLDAAKALLTNNANVRKPLVLLHSAIEHCPELVESLLENGVPVSGKNNRGKTPSSLAILFGKPDLFELLVKFGAPCGVRHACYIDAYNCDRNESLKLFEAFLNYDFREVHPASESASIRKLFSRSLPELAEVIARFLVKMTAAYESNSVEELIPKDLHSRLNLSCLKGTCQAEIAEMKQKNIGRTSVTFFDILTASTRQVARCLRNENVFEALKELDVSALYPNYGPIIECRLRKGTWRRESIARGIKLLGLPFSGFRRLPDELKECIVDSLSNQDILVLQKCLQRK